MWIFSQNEFLSVVRHRDDKSLLMIRFRSEEQAEACTLPGEVIITPEADYIARKVVHEVDFKEWMKQQIDDLQYDNYKNSTYSTPMHDMPLMQIWSHCYQFQQSKHPRRNAEEQWLEFHDEPEDEPQTENW